MDQVVQYGMTGLMIEIIYALMSRKGAEKEQTLKVIEKVRKGEVKQGMFAYSEELDIRVARNRGFEEGKLEGKLEGERQANIENAQNYIRRKFGKTSPEYLEAVQQMTLDQIKALWNDLITDIQKQETLDAWFQSYLNQN